MTTYDEARHAGEFILSEANGQRSRETVTIVSGAGELVAGTVLGEITASGKYTASPVAETSGEEGSESAVAILIDAVDATDADVDAAAIVRDAEVNSNCLTYEATVDTDNEIATKATELAAVGIIVR